jgi:L-asparagine transporter-like permease
LQDDIIPYFHICRSRGLEGIHTEIKIVLQVKISRASSPTSSVFCRSRVLEGMPSSRLFYR